MDEAGYIHRGQCCYVGWVFVRVVASADVPAGRDTVYLFNRDCLGAYGLAGQYVLPAMFADETLLVTFDITEPNCASDLMDSLRVIVSGYDAPSYGTGDTLVISVEKPGSLVVDDVVAVADTEFAGYNEPFFTMGQQFYLAVVLRNAGTGRVDDINLNLSSSSVYGCSSYFDTLTAFDTSLSGNDTCVLLIPIVADTINHGGTGTTDDEIFRVSVSGTDANNLGDCGVGYTDDDDSIGIVMPPSLHFYKVAYYSVHPHPSDSLNDWDNYIYWLNAYDALNIQMFVLSEEGDYATADSLDVYNSYLEFLSGAGEVEGIDGVDAPSKIRKLGDGD
ncbi:hypothetical protein J7K99_03740, partial [bacterium]|nr:hypothetical protein [bacterium]